MTLRFPYLTQRTRTRQNERARPRVGVIVRNPDRPSIAWPRDALLDTGSDDTLFPGEIAEQLEIDLTQARAGHIRVANGERVPVQFARVLLQLDDADEIRAKWSAEVGFVADGLAMPLLGFGGCLRFFDATFYGKRQEAVLEPNELFYSLAAGEISSPESRLS